jgi:hypothetical protein
VALGLVCTDCLGLVTKNYLCYFCVSVNVALLIMVLQPLKHAQMILFCGQVGATNAHAAHIALLLRAWITAVCPVLAPIQVPKSPISPVQNSPSRHHSTHSSVVSDETRALASIATSLQQVIRVNVLIIWLFTLASLQLLLAVKENNHQHQKGRTSSSLILLPVTQINLTLLSDVSAAAAARSARDILMTASQSTSAPSVSNIEASESTPGQGSDNRQNQKPVSRDCQQGGASERRHVPASSFSKAAEDASAGATAGTVCHNPVDCWIWRVGAGQVLNVLNKWLSARAGNLAQRCCVLLLFPW